MRRFEHLNSPLIAAGTGISKRILLGAASRVKSQSATVFWYQLLTANAHNDRGHVSPTMAREFGVRESKWYSNLALEWILTIEYRWSICLADLDRPKVL
jgi:hypothetical protein